MYRIALFLLIIHNYPCSTHAQTSKRKVDTQELVWLRYYNKINLKKQWQLHSELETRQFISHIRLHQWLLPRIHLHYIVDKRVDIGVGACYFLHALPQVDDKEIEVLRQELRPHQELNLNQDFGIIQLNHRYKIEERFFVKTAEDSADFIFRARYKLQVQIPLNRLIRKIPISLVFYDEIMLNWGNGVGFGPFDQNRIFAAMALKLSDSWAIEVGYMNIFQQRATVNNLYNRHILRTTLNHSIKKI